MELTPLEEAIMTAYHDRYADRGFPHPDRLVVTERVSDSAGRCTRFAPSAAVALKAGRLGLGVYSQFDMEGLRAGASFHLWIEAGRIERLDIYVNGDTGWDGVERNWVLLDPGDRDTALFA